MKKLKFLLGPTLVVVLLCAMSLNNDLPQLQEEIEIKHRISTVVQLPVVDLEDIYLYNLRKKALNVAVTQYFETAIQHGDILGTGISIVQGDSIVFSGGFGKRKTDREELVNGETIFRLGSLSKGFAGVLAGSLKYEGALNWDDKVNDYIPDFKLGSNKNSTNITLANILSHTSGTPYHSYTDLIENGLSLMRIAPMFGKVAPISQPGALYSYQNAMFALSGEIMQLATGNDIGYSLREKFFKPLGMLTASTDYNSIADSENVAYPHSKRRSSWRSIKLTDKYYNAIAAGGVNASAQDMAKWMHFLLGHNPEVLNKVALQDVFTPQIEVKGHNKYYQRWPGHISSHYGFGWRIHKYKEDRSGDEKTIIHHGGSVNSYRNEVAIYPEDDLGVCVLFNSNSTLAKTVIPDLHKLVKEIFCKSLNQLEQQQLASN